MIARKKTKSKPVRRQKPSKPVKPVRVYTFSARTRKRMSQSAKGRKLSQETKDKISAARQEREALIQMGLLPKFRHTEETKAHLRRVMKKSGHKPNRKALRNSVSTRRNKKLDRLLARKVAQGKL